MRTILLPDNSQWAGLCRRPALEGINLETQVREILASVKADKDEALRRYSQRFDGIVPDNLKVTPAETDEAEKLVPDELKKAIRTAMGNIGKFHSAQMISENAVETFPGVRCWRKNVPVEKVGLYIPGGSAPLFSTVLMLAVPAKIAGCNEIILCTPPSRDGSINPVILYTARITGITGIYKTGGAQAIAAMAYGTETVPKVYKIFGPGNQYVTKAKELVQQEGVAIDMPAGPSEVLVIADRKASPDLVASDLLSQAEHGPDSQVILLSDSEEMISRVRNEIEQQLKVLPRKDIASAALSNSRLILLPSLMECIEFSNMYAPEHLIINTSEPQNLAEKVINAGSVFLGEWSCESAGDYASGTNHTLPTNGYARNYSGVSTDSFLRKITFQEISGEGMKGLGPAIEAMAEAESLDGHKNAVRLRLKKLDND